MSATIQFIVHLGFDKVLSIDSSNDEVIDMDHFVFYAVPCTYEL